MGWIDLHTHSTASDGTLTPLELVRMAAGIGLEAMALTDHDTVAGVREAADTADSVGIHLIPGIELEVELEGDDEVPGSCHILGIGIDPDDSSLVTRIEDLQVRRAERNRTIIGKMRRAGIGVDYDDVRALAGGTQVGRPHIARYLVEKEIARNEIHAFQRYLGEGGDFFVPRSALSLDDALETIHRAGGKAVVAHPQTLFVSWTGLIDRLSRWRRQGLDGVEAFHPNLRWSYGRRISGAAEALGLIVSAGSDYHGPGRRDRRLGRTADGHKIDSAFLEPFACRNQTR